MNWIKTLIERVAALYTRVRDSFIGRYRTVSRGVHCNDDDHAEH